MITAVDIEQDRSSDTSIDLTGHPRPGEMYLGDAGQRRRKISSQASDRNIDAEASTFDQGEAQQRTAHGPVFHRPTEPAQDVFRPLAKWEGTVLSVTDDGFRARVVNKTEHGPEEEADFSTEEVSPSDRDLIGPGAGFIWSVGYFDTKTGQRITASRIRFRRLPNWTPGELDEAKRLGRTLRQSLGW